MFISQYFVYFAVSLITVSAVTNCVPIQTTRSDIFNFNNIEKFAMKLLDKIERSRVLRINDFLSIETIGNTTGRTTHEQARLLDKLEDISNTKSLNLDLGLVDVKLFQDAGEFNVDLKLDPRKHGDKKEGDMLIPLLIGLKATTFIVGAVSLIALLTLKAFIASKTAILIAMVLGLKKLFGGHQKTTYEAVHDRYSFAPEYHHLNEHHNEPEYFKGHPEIPEQKLSGVYEMLKDQKEMLQNNNEAAKYEYQGQETNPEVLKGQDFHGLFGDNLQEFKLENHQKRRSWKNNGKRKPLSLVIGSPHHEPPVLTYRKVVTGRNA